MSIREAVLVPLGPEHTAAILAGQDDALVAEVFGTRWTEAALRSFLERTSRWPESGPVHELAVLDPAGVMVGGGGIRRNSAGLERGQTELTFWVLSGHRGIGWGARIAAELCERARAPRPGTVLVLRIAPENPASQAVARSLGFRRTGRTSAHPADRERRVEHWELPGPLAPRPSTMSR